MTKSSNRAELPTGAEAALARKSGRLLASQLRRSRHVQVQLADRRAQQSVKLPAGAARLLVRILDEMACGNAVRLVPIQPELTTQEAADMLGISRPSLIQLLDQRKIAYRRVGTHRRVRFDALIRYKREADAGRRAALAELAAYDQELGI